MGRLLQQRRSFTRRQPSLALFPSPQKHFHRAYHHFPLTSPPVKGNKWCPFFICTHELSPRQIFRFLKFWPILLAPFGNMSIVCEFHVRTCSFFNIPAGYSIFPTLFSQPDAKLSSTQSKRHNKAEDKLWDVNNLELDTLQHINRHCQKPQSVS